MPKGSIFGALCFELQSTLEPQSIQIVFCSRLFRRSLGRSTLEMTDMVVNNSNLFDKTDRAHRRKGRSFISET